MSRLVRTLLQAVWNALPVIEVPAVHPLPESTLTRSLHGITPADIERAGRRAYGQPDPRYTRARKPFLPGSQT